ncbi:putative uncharacterized protein DDB_G0271606 [Anastrepha ludens]|uniref:putative uncharacterized protein DDB_G0271606 n=1 Tax=Anastrepha ludens TaxID=28586 RepID=UPI0023AF2DC6|nr:putative uncharacterized protein DDB_G0271606 [Anastrepha ludens]
MKICNTPIANLALMRQRLLDGGPIIMACYVQAQLHQQQRQTEQQNSLKQQCIRQLKQQQESPLQQCHQHNHRGQQKQHQQHPQKEHQQFEVVKQQQQQQSSAACQQLSQQQEQHQQLISSWRCWLHATLKLLYQPMATVALLLQLLVLLSASTTALGEGNVGEYQCNIAPLLTLLQLYLRGKQ